MADLTATDNRQIKAAVKLGNRPPLDAITGPADLVSFAMKWIPLCWHQSPEQRPSFDGEHCAQLSLCLSGSFRVLLCLVYGISLLSTAFHPSGSSAVLVTSGYFADDSRSLTTDNRDCLFF